MMFCDEQNGYFVKTQEKGNDETNNWIDPRTPWYMSGVSKNGDSEACGPNPRALARFSVLAKLVNNIK